MTWDENPKCEHIKKNGERCRAPAMSGRSFCVVHIKAHLGGRHPETYSRVPRQNIFTLIRQSKQNPALLDIKEDVAVMDALLKSYLGKVVDENLSAKVIGQAVAIAEKRSQAILRYFQAQKERAETFNLIQVGLIISYLAEVVRRHVTDQEERKKIAVELEEIPYDKVLELQSVQRTGS